MEELRKIDLTDEERHVRMMLLSIIEILKFQKCEDLSYCHFNKEHFKKTILSFFVLLNGGGELYIVAEKLLNKENNYLHLCD